MIKGIDELKEKINELTVINEKLNEVADRINKFVEDDITKLVEENYTELTGAIAPCYSANDHLQELKIKLCQNKMEQRNKMKMRKNRIKQYKTIISLI